MLIISANDTIRSAIGSAIPFPCTGASTNRTFDTPSIFAAASAAPEHPDEAHRIITSPRDFAAVTAFAVASWARSAPFTSAKRRTAIKLLPLL